MAEYNTDTLIEFVGTRTRPPSYFLDTHFGSRKTFSTETVSFDLQDGKRRITPLVSPLMPGKVVDPTPFSTGTIRPPYAKDKRRFNPLRALKRRPGEGLNGSGLITPQARRDAAIDEYTEDGLQMLQDRQEVMASEALRLGTVTLSGEGFETVTVNFQRSAGLTVTLAGAARWNQTGANPLGDLETWSALVDGGGTLVTMAPDVWSNMRARLVERGEDVMLTAFARSGNSALDLAAQSTQDERVNRIGNIGRFSIATYDDTYYDDADTQQHFMPSGWLTMASPGRLLGTRLFGAILDPRAGLRELEYFAKTWIEEDPGVEWWLLQSAPIVVPFRPNASLGAKVF